MTKFSLTYKTYQDEDYTSEPIKFMDKIIKFGINMQYHTFRKYWSVHYNWYYGDKYFFPIKSERAENRKHARQIAKEWMVKVNIMDINKIQDKDFYIRKIQEN